MTVCIQIGNSDDKLTQREWSEFVRNVSDLVDFYQDNLHFFGTSDNSKPWQNACWVFDIGENNINFQNFGDRIQIIRQRFNQHSVAILNGSTVLV